MKKEKKRMDGRTTRKQNASSPIGGGGIKNRSVFLEEHNFAIRPTKAEVFTRLSILKAINTIHQRHLTQTTSQREWGIVSNNMVCLKKSSSQT